MKNSSSDPSPMELTGLSQKAEDKYKTVDDDSPSDSLIKTVLSQAKTIEGLLEDNRILNSKLVQAEYTIISLEEDIKSNKTPPKYGPAVEFDEIRDRLEIESSIEKREKKNEKLVAMPTGGQSS